MSAKLHCLDGPFTIVSLFSFMGIMYAKFFPVPFMIMGRVTYVHHYLPTLYFSVLMFAHLVDHFVFTAKRLSEKTKWIAFGALSFSIVACFWWFRGFAFGMDGPINEHWGLQWRKVSLTND